MTDTPDYQEITLNNAKKKEEPAPNLDYISYVMVPILLVIGLGGNAMTIAIMRQPSFHHMTINVILTTLSLSDSIVILMVPFNLNFVVDVLRIDIRAISNWGCKIYFWFWRTSKMTSSWFIVLISMERFVAVWFPLKAKMINTRRNIKVAIMLVYIGVGTYNAVWGYLADHLRGTKCIPNMGLTGMEEVVQGFLLSGTFIYSLLPASVIFLFNALIVGKLHAEQRRRESMMEETLPSKRGSAGKDNKTSQTTIMLVVVSVTFVVLVVPISLVHCVSNIIGEPIFETQDPVITVFRGLTQIMEQANYSTNFILYLLCSARFRTEALTLLGCAKKSGLVNSCSQGNKSYISSITTDTVNVSSIEQVTKCQSTHANPQG